MPSALVASPAEIVILCIAAVYFAALAYSSYQQMNIKDGQNGKDGKDANFGTIMNDEIKSGTIIAETLPSD